MRHSRAFARSEQQSVLVQRLEPGKLEAEPPAEGANGTAQAPSLGPGLERLSVHVRGADEPAADVKEEDEADGALSDWPASTSALPCQQGGQSVSGGLCAVCMHTALTYGSMCMWGTEEPAAEVEEEDEGDGALAAACTLMGLALR